MPTNNCATNPNGANTGFYNCPSGLGIVTHTIGSPLQVQVSLRLDFKVFVLASERKGGPGGLPLRILPLVGQGTNGGIASRRFCRENCAGL